MNMKDKKNKRREHDRRYYLRHREEIRDKKRRWYESNRDHARERSRARYRRLKALATVGEAALAAAGSALVRHEPGARARTDAHPPSHRGASR